MKKVVKLLCKMLVAALMLMVAGVFVMWFLFFRINTVEQVFEESVWESQGNRNALILYQKSRFSLTQNTVTYMAEALQKEGYSVVANHPRHDLQYEIQDYDLGILCSPVYGGTVSQPLLDYGSSHDFSGRKVVVVITGKDLSADAEIRMVTEVVSGTDDVNGLKTDRADDAFRQRFLSMITE